MTIYFVFAPSFAKAFDNWMIGLLLWMSPLAGVILADFYIKRRSGSTSPNSIARLSGAPTATSTGAAIDRLPGRPGRRLVVEDGLVPALQGPISTELLGGADLSWLVGIVVAGAVYLALSRRRMVPAYT